MTSDSLGKASCHGFFKAFPSMHFLWGCSLGTLSMSAASSLSCLGPFGAGAHWSKEWYQLFPLLAVLKSLAHLGWEVPVPTLCLLWPVAGQWPPSPWWQLRAHHQSGSVRGRGVPLGTQTGRLTQPPQRPLQRLDDPATWLLLPCILMPAHCPIGLAEGHWLCSCGTPWPFW